jgi:HEAT repeat protein
MEDRMPNEQTEIILFRSTANPLRVWQIRRRCAKGVLACFCALGLALAAHGQTDRVNQLIRQLKDPNSGVRRNAADALGEIKDPRAVEPLIAALKDRDDYDLRQSVTSALRAIGTPAVEPLIAALKGPDDSHVRGYAANALGIVQDPSAVEPLIAALKDTDSGVRSVAAWALGRIKDPRAVGPLIAALKDSNEHVRESAAEALAFDIGTPAVTPLIAALKDSDAQVRDYGVWALGRIKDHRAVEPLIAALTDANSDVRRNAAVSLGLIEDARARDSLTAALKDTDADVRASAADALGYIKAPPAVKPLTALKDTDAPVGQKVDEALGQIKDSRVVEDLITALKDPNSSKRESSVLALWEIRDPRAVVPLTAALKDDPDFRVRTSAATALIYMNKGGIIKDPRELEEIIELLIAELKNRDNPFDQGAALDAFRDLKDSLTAALKEPDPEIRGNAAAALNSMLSMWPKEYKLWLFGEPTTAALGAFRDLKDSLTAAVKDPDTEVRRNATGALNSLLSMLPTEYKPSGSPVAAKTYTSNSLVGHWECISSQMPTGLFLFRTFDFRADRTFRSIDSLQARPPARVFDGTWAASERMITVKYRTWRIGSEGTVLSSEAGFGYGFVDARKSAFETTITYQGGPVDFICGSSLDDIMSRHLLDILKRDIANHKAVR